jgi:hypothetical protein
MIHSAKGRKQQDQRQALDVLLHHRAALALKLMVCFRRPDQRDVIPGFRSYATGQHHIRFDQLAGPVADKNPAVGAVEKKAVDLAVHWLCHFRLAANCRRTGA